MFNKKLLIGMLHLKPLPGSYHYNNDFDSIVDFAIKEAKKIEEAGFDAVMIENFGDAPFKKEAGKITIASMAVIAKAIKEEVSLPLGINVLRNDAVGAYSIAYVVKADFIRVNVLSGVAFTDQGIIEGNAHELAKLKKLIPSKIKVFADVHVKHAYHFIDFESSLLDTVERGLADAVVVSGKRTGKEVDIEKLKLAKELVDVPVIVGSGTTYDNLKKLWDYADGFIIGTWIKRDGNVKNEIDIERAKKIVNLANRLRG
ncbi:BtpA/SgcQ family protein [Methanocaldococcus fervens]|uniref:Photosystem I assembly BtpA n=1 Tax=Methanocaldococcus fervens (strain DSM 4213 / JCM 15782 / AG86) TaxID=573064 RepID=C7P6F7_METFA|nr:BtpA/SgcQ family protein [Methanocaldococcus fervens]ACV24139.1 photosystem I assembly BtpA [Methanocaldococcus fervens AG86]